MQSDAPPLIVITGIMAAGKSTVAEALAERFATAVHLRGDLFRRLIVSGRADMTPDPTPAALAQLRLRYRLAALVSQEYLSAGFTVILQDIILGGMLSELLGHFRGRELHLVVLCPRPEVVAQREAARHKRGYGAFEVASLDRVLRDQTPRLGLWLDTSTLTESQTVDAILERLPAARIVP